MGAGTFSPKISRMLVFSCLSLGCLVLFWGKLAGCRGNMYDQIQGGCNHQSRPGQEIPERGMTQDHPRVEQRPHAAYSQD